MYTFVNTQKCTPMFRDRLEKVLQKYNLTAAKLAEILEVQPSSISHLLSGRNKPSFDFLQRFAAKMPQINVDWLITGNGNMTKVAVQKTLFSGPETNTVQHEMNQESHWDENKNNKTESHTNINTKQKDKITCVNNKRVVTRVIILYNDNTFDSFDPNTSD